MKKTIFNIVILSFVLLGSAASYAAETPVETAPQETAIQPQEEVAPSETKQTKSLATKSLAMASSSSSSGATGASSFNAGILSSFQTDLFSGKATLSVPIQVPAGRSGIQPNLSLIYQSGGPNTWCGLGWLLDTGSISRSTKKGAPNYNSTDTFVFNFNGSSQELINIGGSEYRAKIESSFMKFEYKNPYWLVTDTKGTKYYLGQTSASRQQKDSSNIYSWSLDKAIDINSNYMAIVYQSDQNQLYPLSITYTGNETQGDAPKYSVTLSLETRPDITINYRSGIKVTTAKRLKEVIVKYDTQLTRKYILQYQPTTDFNKQSLLKSITLYGSDGVSTLPPVGFAYAQQNSNFADVNPWSGVRKPASESDAWLYIRNKEGDSTKVDIYDINGDGLPDRVMAGQVTSRNTWNIQTGNGSGFNEGIMPWSGVNSEDPSAENWMAIRATNGSGVSYVDAFDINGDGLPDRVMRSKNAPYTTWKVQLNNGYGFNGSISSWPGVNSPYPSDESWMAIRAIEPGGITWVDIFDINGDGLPDRIMKAGTYSGIQPNEWKVQLNNGNGFDAIKSWPGVEAAESGDGYLAIRYQGFEMTYVDIFDINGDGLPDRVTRGNSAAPGAWKVQLNTGNSFAPTIDWTVVEPAENAPGYYAIRYYGSTMTYVEIFDINGDGLPDRVTRGNDAVPGTWKVQLNNGSGFNRTMDWPNVHADQPGAGYVAIRYSSSGYVYADTLDIDGDGLIDRVMIGETGNYNTWKIQKNNNAAQSLIASVSNGIGATTTITYKNYNGKANTTYDINKLLPFSMWVVDTITQDSGFGQQITTTYSYDNAFFDFTEREFRGFGKVVISDQEGNCTESYFYQDATLKGRPYKQLVKDFSGNIWAKSESSYVTENLCNTLVKFPYANETTNYVYSGTSSDEESYLKKTKTTNSYIFSDNLVSSTTVTYLGDLDVDGDEKTQVTTFDNSLKALDYIVMLPAESDLKDVTDITVSKSWNTYNAKGQLIKATAGLASLTDPNDSGNPSTSYEYNSYGNLIKTTDPLGRYITTAYETTLKQYPQTITNILGHTQSFTYDYKTGQILTSKDPNNQITTNQYDTFGRLLKIFGPKDTDNNASVIYGYDLLGSPCKITKSVKQQYGVTPNYITTYSFIDGFGRVLETKSPAQGGKQIISGIVEYDYRGNVAKAYMPYYTQTPSSSYEIPQYAQPYTQYQYDTLSRVVQTTSPDLTYSTTSYNGWAITSMDENSNTKDSYFDAYGQLTQVVEHNGINSYNTYYSYDLLNNLIQVKDNQNNITTITYDILGRKVSMIDPDMGNWLYEYDKVGNLIKQTDAKGQVIQFEYDALNRLIRKLGQSPIFQVQYIYDDTTQANRIGRLSKVIDPASTTEFFYDELGREIKTIKTINGIPYTVQRTYDAMDRLVTLTYPDADTVTYAYNTSSGQLESISGYITSIKYNEYGQMSEITYANGAKTNYDYSPQTLRLQNLSTVDSQQSTVQNLSYQFDNVGNITSILDSVKTATQSFVYDDLNRLTQATGAYGTRNYSYDSIGNILQKGNALFNYDGANGGTRPHAVTSSADGNYAFTYDDNGNTLIKITPTKQYSYEYDTQNRLTKATIQNPAETLTVSIPLQPGWNFVSLPVIPTGAVRSGDTYTIPITQALSSLVFGTDYDQVSRIIPGSGGHQSWCNDSRFNQFTNMEYMRGYQIYALRASTLTITGTLPQGSTSLSLHNGHNLIGVSVINDGKTPPEAFNGIPYTVIKTLDASGHLQPVSDTTPLEKGKSYYITVTADSTYSETTLFGQTTFTYDGDGGRIKRVTPDETTIFVGSLYEIKSTVLGQQSTVKHIFMGDTRICSVDCRQSTVDYSYYHGDHLGSTSDITDATGALVQHTEYLPYGETYIQEGEQKTEYLYTGKLLDRSTGLYYYGARYYDPEIARFTQADSIIPDPADPQAFNRYSYARNNPIKYTDPTGHSWWKKIGDWFKDGGGAILIGIAVAALTAWAMVPAIASISGIFAASGVGTTFAEGFIIGALEMGIPAFTGTLAGGVASGQKFNTALKNAAIAGGITALTAGVIEGAYAEGWQSIMHFRDVRQDQLNQVSKLMRNGDLTKANEMMTHLARKYDMVIVGIDQFGLGPYEPALHMDVYASTTSGQSAGVGFDYTPKTASNFAKVLAGKRVDGAFSAKDFSNITKMKYDLLILKETNPAAVNNAISVIDNYVGKEHYYQLHGQRAYHCQDGARQVLSDIGLK